MANKATTVRSLINKLQKFAMTTPGGAGAMVMLQYDGNVCMAFGEADFAAGTPEESFLVLKPDPQGQRIHMIDVGIKQ